MRPGIIMALVASLSVVGWATWYRYVSTPPKAELAAVATPKIPQSYYDELIAKFNASSTTPATSVEPLTTTDLVGRQLVSDYISLAQSGQATDDNLTALAERYVDSIPTVLPTEHYSGLDLQVVSNDLSNFQSYATALEEEYRAYATSLINSSGNGNISADAAGAKRFAKMGDIYAKAAETLKSIPVPAQLAEEHVALVNIYLQDAVAVRALANFDGDPTSSFAGLLAYQTNADKEAETFSQIQSALAQHGI